MLRMDPFTLRSFGQDFEKYPKIKERFKEPTAEQLIRGLKGIITDCWDTSEPFLLGGIIDPFIEFDKPYDEKSCLGESEDSAHRRLGFKAYIEQCPKPVGERPLKIPSATRTIHLEENADPNSIYFIRYLDYKPTNGVRRATISLVEPSEVPEILSRLCQKLHKKLIYAGEKAGELSQNFRGS